MGLLAPSIPNVNYEEWRTKNRMQRVRPMLVDWAENGFSPPEAVYVLYIVKFVLYGFVGLLVAAATSGFSIGHLGNWWWQPIVLQKFIIFTLLFEVLGLGCGFGPLTLRFLPPIGGPLFWLRPGTVRMPPWPNKIPGTKGSRRNLLDVALYVGVIASAIWALSAHGTRSAALLGSSAGLLTPSRIGVLSIVLVLLGLRDKTIFLAARSEVYLLMSLTFFLSPLNFIFALKLLMVLIWWGAATSKLNRHFPFVVATMESNNPLVRIKAMKRHLYQDFPNDLRPSKLARNLAHGGTVFEFSVPLLLLLSHGGTLTNVLVILMVIFHLQILVALPMGVPLEWNVFMMYAVSVLFFHDAHYSIGAAPNGVLLLLGTFGLYGLVLLGNFFPSKFSFLLSMRYYAGNWATSLWCFSESGVAKLKKNIVAFPGLPSDQLEKLYGSRAADLLTHKGYAFRAMHSHGRALFGLIPRAAGPRHEDDYFVVDGEFVAGSSIGWNFGEGHLHNEQLVQALQERCDFMPGEVRAIIVESQPMHRQLQEYRLIDAASGEFERGTITVEAMCERQPWSDEIPVTVISQRSAES